MHTRKAITEAIRKLGVQTGDLLMVHASLKAIGPVEGGAETVVAALRSAVGPTGTVMGYASWDRSPYEETLNGARLDDKARRTAAVRSRNGRDLPWVRPAESISGSSPGARRSAHPDASMVAVGPLAETLTEPHELGHALGEGSPVERFVRLGEKALLLGAPLNSVTALHYAEAVADIPNKRWVTYEMPMLGRNGEVALENGIRIRFKRHSRLLCYRRKAGCGRNYSKCLREARSPSRRCRGLCSVLPVRRAGHRDVRRHLS